MKRLLNETYDIVRYRGGSGHWSYLLHRLTGLGVLLFLCVHIIDTVLIGWGPELFNKVISVYRHPFFRVSEIFLFGAVLYHSLNGVRITLVDLWPGATRRHRLWAHLTWGVFVAGMIPVVLIMWHHWREARP
ncbi:MAG: succinate dehydrogenase, cytochrome b556 subunit [Elusimicrobia bacterium]|jgi:succinate dehydrogenase / fumarate reductase cytochrome b subunit|nr:succinate dehydrogenase, cytochrome b556 subunit [Elusimicrobiota bacterium]MBK7207051.1 succinate dehydrogenase, cytochrome b556 subunit [Elusimicrobiota bacterium]MBK7545871.1 succinate dehydrogenase, cytochrome b556 subunit [Elusimicrobiota bacterium]MBK7575135.1 succinate dehydrogenase, cytochrome b556 subunit [Elusimicrobiota bacterium]MBK7687601.1 succinate dehydrogenase, cytochrome b556 subunit [Elusimicrobiota bacterium]